MECVCECGLVVWGGGVCVCAFGCGFVGVMWGVGFSGCVCVCVLWGGGVFFHCVFSACVTASRSVSADITYRQSISGEGNSFAPTHAHTHSCLFLLLLHDVIKVTFAHISPHGALAFSTSHSSLGR